MEGNSSTQTERSRTRASTDVMPHPSSGKAREAEQEAHIQQGDGRASTEYHRGHNNGAELDQRPTSPENANLPVANSSGTANYANATNDIEQDDVLGNPILVESSPPEYFRTGDPSLDVARIALEERSGFDLPEGSAYFIPRSDPATIDLSKFLRTSYFNPPPGLTSEQWELLNAYFTVIDRGEWDIVKQLLDSGLVDANSSGVYRHNGCTPLLAAVRGKHKNVIILLIENGALVDGWGVLTRKYGTPVYKESDMCLRTPPNARSFTRRPTNCQVADGRLWS